MESATIVRETTFDGLFNKLKTQMITSLGYTEEMAKEQAERISMIFKNAYSE